MNAPDTQPTPDEFEHELVELNTLARKKTVTWFNVALSNRLDRLRTAHNRSLQAAMLAARIDELKRFPRLTSSTELGKMNVLTDAIDDRLAELTKERDKGGKDAANTIRD